MKAIMLVLVSIMTFLAKGQELIYPKSGDTLYIGETITFKWKSHNKASESVYIKLEIPNSPSQYIMVVSAYHDIGSLKWKVDTRILGGTNFIMTMYNGISPFSSIPIRIVPGKRTVTTTVPKPEQPEVSIKKAVEIKWNSVSNAYYKISFKNSFTNSPTVVVPLIAGNGEVMSYLSSTDGEIGMYYVERIQNPDFTSQTHVNFVSMNSEFIDTSFTNSVFLSGNVNGSNFMGANMSDVVAYWTSFVDTAFTYSDLSNATFYFSDFSRSNLAWSQKEGSIFFYCDFTGANLGDLTGTRLIMCIMPDGSIRDYP